MEINYEKIKELYYNERDLLQGRIILGNESYYAYQADNSNSDFSPRICFGTSIEAYKYSRYINLELRVFTKPKYYSKDSDVIFNNVTWMNSDQLKEHIDYVRNHIGIEFDYDITPLTRFNWGHLFKHKELKQLYGYNISINCKKEKVTVSEYKFLLFWIRLAYRYPQNILLADMYTLHKRLGSGELYNLITIPSEVFSYFDENFLTCSKSVLLSVLKRELKENRFIERIFSGKGLAPTTVSAILNHNPIPVYSNFGRQILPENILEKTDRFDEYTLLYDRLQ